MGRVGAVSPAATGVFLASKAGVAQRGVARRAAARLSGRAVLFAIAALSAVASAPVLLRGAAYAEHGRPELHTTIEVTVALVALLAVRLVAGRYAIGARLRDLALVAALSALPLSTMLVAAAPPLGLHVDSVYADWAPPLLLLLAATGLVAACFCPDVRLRRPRRAAALAGLGVAGATALISALPAGASLPPVQAGAAAPTGYLIVQLAAAALFGIAAFGFARGIDRSRDAFLAWLGIGCTFAALSALHEYLVPVGWTESVMTADLFQLAFCLALLAGTLGEITAYQRRVAVAAVLDERRRMARDLHDGLAQELAYIKMEAHRLARRAGDERARHLAAAAERALAESREAITALRERHDDPFAAELSQVAEQLAVRAGARLRLDLDASLDVDEARRDPLLRIVREAVTNGVRHGDATEVALELSGGDDLRVTVRDNGSGFTPGAPRPAGSFGLDTMRERARALGGDLTIDSRPGEGTTVEVTLP